MDRRMQFPLGKLGVLVVASLVLATTGTAQRSPSRRTKSHANEPRGTYDDGTKGFTYGLYVLAAPGLTFTGQDIDGTFTTKLGEGLGATLGYAFNSRFSTFASLDVAKQASEDYGGSFGLAHFEVGARMTIPLSNPEMVPYVSASVGTRALSAHVQDYEENTDYDMALTGTMLGVGGGVQRTLSRTMSLDAGVELGFGSFTHYDIAGEKGALIANGVTSIRMRFGVTWRR